MKCILFIADAVRPDYLGCYGDTAANTPAIDRLAANGVRFQTVISAAPWTAPSTASIISGIYAYKHQIFTWDRGLPGAAYTLFHAFADNGHAAASFVFDRQFLFSAMPFARVQGNTGDFERALNWLAAHARQDFFLLIHSWATHMPYNVHHAARKEWKAAKTLFIHRLQTGGEEAAQESRAAYRRAIEYSDGYQIARLMDHLAKAGIADDTLFIFMADHGESWGERFADKSHIRGIHHLHGRFLYDDTLRVPLILHWPNRLPAGAVIAPQTRTVDLAPTLLELAGITPPAGAAPMDGTSLMLLISGAQTAPRPAISATSEHGRLSKMSLRTPPHKLILTLEPEQVELYHLPSDPAETTNLAAREPEPARRLGDQLKAELASVTQRELTDEEAATLTGRLEQLGYL
ncbi:MAG: sulfatase [Anaerolineae bacterium]